VTIRGHVAIVQLTPAGDTFVASWQEGPEGAPCSEYAVFATGLDLPSFLLVLAGVR
jgi:hypothetical protein